MKLNVSNIQHFSLGDGDGIRTTVFLKGCNLRCPWCHNPETITPNAVDLNYVTGTETSGKLMEIDDVVKEVLEDAVFYGEDGGLTVSGGEPMLQVDAVAVFLEKLKEKGVNAVIDTAGCVWFESFKKLGNLVHTYFFDFKACNAEDYRKIGGNFGVVYGNLKRLIAGGRRVRVRIPLIPNFNNSPEYSIKMCEKLKEAGVTKVDILPFHRLGTGKYEAMGLEYAYKNEPMMSRETAEKTAEIYRNHFKVRIEG